MNAIQVLFAFWVLSLCTVSVGSYLKFWAPSDHLLDVYGVLWVVWVILLAIGSS